MKLSLSAAAAALILLAGTSALAQRGFGPSADANHDGKVSKAEFIAAMQARMAERGGDGPQGAAGFAAAAFARMDLNGDGYITKDEIAKATAQRFAAMDTAHKGYVTADEMRQSRGGR